MPGNSKRYYRPLVQMGPQRPKGAQVLAGGWCWFTEVEVISREVSPRIVPAQEIPAEALSALTTQRAAVSGLCMSRPRIMGILNVTPDSFSDGGQFHAPGAAIAQADKLITQGADLLDIGGESTRPGAEEVPVAQEIDRTIPIIEALGPKPAVPVSIDTRKSSVARAALAAGASILNDVAAMTFDPAMAEVAAESGAPICLMHAQGDPKIMQANPQYDDVLLDVYDYLAERVSAAEAAGIARERVIVDPGIGFGKTMEHNLTLLRNLSLFQGLGCSVLLGASRKRFVGTLTGRNDAKDRVAGSVGVAIAAVGQGVQIVRVHDVAETRDALTMWLAAIGAGA